MVLVDKQRQERRIVIEGVTGNILRYLLEQNGWILDSVSKNMQEVIHQHCAFSVGQKTKQVLHHSVSYETFLAGKGVRICNFLKLGIGVGLSLIYLFRD